jgi:TRAP-type C4-dicarboxylate transport system permease small subunit
MFETALNIGERFTAVLRRCVTVLVIVFYTYMASAVVTQVFGRYVFNYSIGWASETATFAQIWMVLLAAGVAMHRNLHVGVDALARKFPLAIRRLLIFVTGVAAFWFLWQAISGSMAMIEIGQMQTSPAIGLPMWIPYLSLPIGLTYFGFEVMLALVAKWNDPDDEPHLVGDDAS